jgi:hypothetical protein
MLVLVDDTTNRLWIGLAPDPIDDNLGNGALTALRLSSGLKIDRLSKAFDVFGRDIRLRVSGGGQVGFDGVGGNSAEVK